MGTWQILLEPIKVLGIYGGVVENITMEIMLPGVLVDHTHTGSNNPKKINWSSPYEIWVIHMLGIPFLTRIFASKI